MSAIPHAIVLTVSFFLLFAIKHYGGFENAVLIGLAFILADISLLDK